MKMPQCSDCDPSFACWAGRVTCRKRGPRKRVKPTMREALEAVATVAERIETAIPEYNYEMNLVRAALKISIK